MLDRDKVLDHLLSVADDTNSELDRFAQDFMILIEHGNFDAEESEEEGQE